MKGGLGSLVQLIRGVYSLDMLWRRENSVHCLYEDSKLKREGLEYRKKDRFI
jgi:hypothetical protein